MSGWNTFRVTRREALAITAGMCAALGLKQAVADDAPVPIVDTHTHFYDPTRPEGVPWPSPNDPALYRPVLPAEYQKLTAPLGVVGTVVVEASPWVADNQWVLDLAKNNPFVLGLVGHLQPGSPEFAEHFAKLSAQPKFLGIRVNAAPLAAGLEQDAFLADVRKLQESGRELDVNGGPSLLPLVDRLAAAVPNLRIVINHLANVRIDGAKIPEDWLRDLRAVARHPHVFLKVSALVEGAAQGGRKAPADPQYYQPILQAVWETFGADRVIYGSNWPVSARYADYATVQTIVQHFVQSQPVSHQRKFFCENAKLAYRWP